MVTIGGGMTGHIYAKSQVSDYQHRGASLERYNLFEFIANTYEDEHAGRSAPRVPDPDVNELC